MTLVNFDPEIFDPSDKADGNYPDPTSPDGSRYLSVVAKEYVYQQHFPDGERFDPAAGCCVARK